MNDFQTPSVTELPVVYAPTEHDDFAERSAVEREVPQDYAVCIIETAKEMVEAWNQDC